jgi:UDP-N-acetyl-D-mannosaminuronate dehydrogenase
VTVPLVRALEERGAEVRVNDPLIPSDEVERNGLVWGELHDGWAEALVLQAAHSRYRDLAPPGVPGVRAVLDGRGVLDPGPWKEAGVAFAGIGR